MRTLVDLHMHTLCSDGRRTPTELAQLLVAAGVTAAALTDHDTVEGIAALEAALAGSGIRIIPGVEVSLEHGGQDLHILAYFVDRADPGLLTMLQGIRDSRRARIREMVSALVAIGVPITEGDVLACAANAAAVGRPHLARALLEKQWVALHRDAFRYYIGADGPAYRPKQTVGLEACLGILRHAGAVSVLAHPGVYRLEGVLERLVAAGLEGLEVYHPAHGPAATAEFELLADRWGLIRTGGSDYHGEREGEMMPGSMDLGEEILKNLEERRTARSPENR